MSVDSTDDCTFWYSNQFLKSDGTFNWSTSIASFKFTTDQKEWRLDASGCPEACQKRCEERVAILWIQLTSMAAIEGVKKNCFWNVRLVNRRLWSDLVR
jgi:hypothetical protein